MVEPADARELIDEAVERSEARFEKDERRFRDRVSILVGLFAVALAVIHMAAAGSARESLLKGIEASDTFAYMQAKIVRETVLSTAAASAGADDKTRLAWRKEATRLRRPDPAGHGIVQLQKSGERLRAESSGAAIRGESYELGETGLQLAIVLLSIALVARSRPIVIGATLLALLGTFCAVASLLGMPVHL